MSETVSVRLPDELAQRLEDHRSSYPYDIAKSEVIRTALDEHLERHESEE